MNKCAKCGAEAMLYEVLSKDGLRPPAWWCRKCKSGLERGEAMLGEHTRSWLGMANFHRDDTIRYLREEEKQRAYIYRRYRDPRAAEESSYLAHAIRILTELNRDHGEKDGEG